jgi:Type 9 secretion system plug protein 1st domain
MMKCVVVMLALVCSIANAQEYVVRGLSIYGLDDEQNFPVIERDTSEQPLSHSSYITIQFDVDGKEPPQLKIQFLHCNRDWIPDQNLFVQDENHNTSFILDYRSSPNGVKYYSYRYKNRFPDGNDIVRFSYSGNWIFRLMDKDGTFLLGEGRFFVVDDIANASVKVTNGYLTDQSSPLNQIHKVQVAVQLPNEVEGYYYTTVDIYQNRRLYNAYRVDVNDNNPYTTVEGFNFGYRLFTILNILPGNEYRTLNISNTTQYPNRLLVRPVHGVDQPRPYWRTGSDRDGTAMLNPFTGSSSDYLDVLFRLDLTSTQGTLGGGVGVFLAGPFNDWNPIDIDELKYDDQEQCYTVRELLRRGVYDYQYITGVWDATSQMVTRQNWVVLEGNDWRTTNVYYAMVYYNDPRFGGFDRIVGFGTGRSPGTSTVTN